MNPHLSSEQCAACLEVLSRGLLRIRSASADGDTARAGAIADALDNLPRLLQSGSERDWTIATFIELFLEPLVEQYPDLVGLKQPFDELR